MKTATLTIEVTDDFNKGNCHECPLSYIPDERDWEDRCVLMRGYSDCPLEIQGTCETCKHYKETYDEAHEYCIKCDGTWFYEPYIPKENEQ